MGDRVALLSTTPPRFQLGEPGAPCRGRSTCTDTVGALIIAAETGRLVSAAQFRAAARPGDPTPCSGLTPAQFLRGLAAFRVRGYVYAAPVTANQVVEATARGIVLVGVGYGRYPGPAECQVGGRTDTGFSGAHAVALYGARNGTAYGVRTRVVMVRDPDHRWGATTPRFDRFEIGLLARAMAALPGTPGGRGSRWTTTFAIWREED